MFNIFCAVGAFLIYILTARKLVKAISLVLLINRQRDSLTVNDYSMSIAYHTVEVELKITCSALSCIRFERHVPL